MDDDEPRWQPVDPRQLAEAGRVFRCERCRTLVLDRDRDGHRCETMAA